MIAASRSVTFTDILILQSIQEAIYQGHQPSKYQIIRIFNEFIEFHGIGVERTTKITNSYSFQQHIDKLRQFLLVTPHKEYCLTISGKELLEKLSNSWLAWPLYLPYTNGTFRYEESYYLK